MAMVKFGDVVVRANTKEDRYNTDRLYYVGGEHMETGEYLITKRGLIEGSTIGPMFYFGFRKGQVLLASRSPDLKKAGMATFDGICSEKTFVIESRDENVLLQTYLPFIVRSEQFWQYANDNQSGSVNHFINWSTFASYEFELPPIEEQAAIAEKGWAMVALRDAYRELILATDALVKSQFIEMFGDPVTNTQSRNVVPFGSYMTSIKYGTSQPPVFSENGKFKFIRATNIKAGRITEMDMLRIDEDAASKLGKCKLSGHEIIIVRSGANTGDTCVVTEDYADQYAGYDIIVSLDPARCNPIFYNELLNTHYMQQVVKPLTVRSAQPHINAQQVQNLPMLEASLEEQDLFAEVVIQSDKSKFELKQAILKIEVMLRALTQKNFY